MLSLKMLFLILINIYAIISTMQKFIRLFTIFLYLCLSLFINNNETLAYEALIKQPVYQYHILQQKNQTELTSKKNDYAIFQSRNNSKITSFTNKNNNHNSKNFDNPNYQFNIANNFLYKNTLSHICISHNISPNLKNAIYTRAP